MIPRYKINTLKCQDQHPQHPTRAVEEWMLVCWRTADLKRDTNRQPDVDWTHAAEACPNLEEMPSFIAR